MEKPGGDLKTLGDEGDGIGGRNGRRKSLWI
jgi:hypothetical protein